MTATESPSGHKTFHEKLDLLKQRLLDMSQLAEDLLATSMQAFLRRDAVKAETVLPADAEVDLLEKQPCCKGTYNRSESGRIGQISQQKRKNQSRDQ